MKVGYRIIERFDAGVGEAWIKYVEWSGLSHLREVIGLDSVLCPSAIREFVDADFSHSIGEWGVTGIFDDLSYTLSRAEGLADSSRVQVVAVSREPALAQFKREVASGLDFVGFDLVDEATWTSALTNCGGFDGAIKPEDLSPCGLIEGVSRAYKVREALRTTFPREAHADCAVWGIWRVSGPIL